MKYRSYKDKIFLGICILTICLTVIILGILIYHVVAEGIPYLTKNLFLNYGSRFPHKAGLKAAFYGTIWLMGLTALFAIPAGIASALFLEEYKIRGKLGKILDANISNLAGVPSIVYGLLGLFMFVHTLGLGQSLLSGSLTLSLLILPVIIVSARESIKAVPDSIRYAAFALGAYRWQVIFFHVLPMALPGIITGVILSLSRAIGETAPLVIIGALSYISFTPEGPLDEFSVLPIQIYNWASRPQAEFHQLAAAGIIVLLVIMLAMNFAAVMIRMYSEKRNRL